MSRSAVLRPEAKIWLNGALVPWDEAVVHVLTHSLHYGVAVFEGIRCYRCADEVSAIFRLPEHMDRLYASAHIMTLTIPYPKEELTKAVLDLVRVNGLREAYIRPIAFIGESSMSVYPADYRVRVAIAAWRWGKYLGDEGMQRGIRAKVSSFTRHHVNATMTRAKVSGYYANSFLAKKEAVDAGYDEAILLDPEGYVCEASGENIFAVRGGIVRTPPLTSVLPGITRDAVIRIAAGLEIEVREERLTRDDLYTADEVFLTGTAAEVTPVREVDGRGVGPGVPGVITQRLREVFFNAVQGQDARYRAWLTFL